MSKLVGPLFVLGLCVVVGLAPLPPATAFVPAESFVALYLQGGGALGFEPPETIGKTTAINPSAPAHASAPPACAATLLQQVGCTNPVLGNVAAPDKFDVVGPAGLTLWMTSTAPSGAYVTALNVDLELVRAAGGPIAIYSFAFSSGSGGANADLSAWRENPRASGPAFGPLDATPRPIRLAAIRSALLDVRESDVLQLVVKRLAVSGAVHGAADIFVHHGPSHASGVLLPADGVRVGMFQAGTTTLPLMFDQQRLRLVPPTGESGLSRRIGAATDARTPTEVLWGRGIVDEATTAAADALFVLDLRQIPLKATDAAPTAGVGTRLHVQVRLRINTTDHFGGTNTAIAPAAATTTGAPFRLVGLIPLRGLAIPANTSVEVGLTLTALNVTNDYEVLFGSAKNPSGILVPVEGGGNLVPVDPTTSSSPPPTTAPSTITATSPTVPPSTTTDPPATQEPSPSNTPATPTTQTSTTQGVSREHVVVKDVSRSGSAPGYGLLAVIAALVGAVLLGVRRPQSPY